MFPKEYYSFGVKRAIIVVAEKNKVFHLSRLIG